MFQFDKEALKERTARAFVERRSVRFQDADAAGIVFFARFFEHFHDAYVNCLTHLGHPLHTTLTAHTWLAPIRHAEADYLKPLRFGVEVEVAIVRAHVATNEMTLGYRVAEAAGTTVFAVGQTVHAFVDAATFRRCPVPPSVAQALTTLGG